jgi:hypothetical protein
MGMSDARDYPLPAYAGYVWWRGDALVVSFPDESGGSESTLVLPAERLAVGSEAASRGWGVLLSVLRARSEAHAAGARATVGSPAAPTRVEVEALLAGRPVPIRRFDARGSEVRDLADLWGDGAGVGGARPRALAVGDHCALCAGGVPLVVVDCDEEHVVVRAVEPGEVDQLGEQIVPRAAVRWIEGGRAP